MSTNLLHAPPGNTAEIVATDLEGTLSSAVAWEGMRDYLFENGREQAYKRFFLRKMPLYLLFKMGLVGREKMKESWILGLLTLFKGFEAEEMAEMGQFVVEKTLWPGRRQTLLHELKVHLKQGRRVIITTGQIEPILAEILKKLDGFEGLGTPVVYEDGLFTGRIEGKLLQGELKADALRPFARNGRILAAYGDTEPDIAMLSMSDEPTAVHPDQNLRRHAEAHGWRILEEAETEQAAGE